MASFMKILFVCTGNSCRSAMAKAYMEKRLKDLKKEGITVSSAGISPFPGMHATKEAQEVLRREGVDISGHVARKLTDSEIRESDLIVVMEEIHRRYILEKDPRAKNKIRLLNIADPMGKDMDFYDETFAAIKEAVEKILKELGALR